MKTKIFLGAYVNFPNAQNINCDHIAKNLDKEKFEVHVMYTSRKPIDKAAYKQAGIKPHRLIHHRFIWFWNKLLTMWLANCDIYYLPKVEKTDILFARIQKHTKKLFVASLEGVVTETSNNTAKMRDYFLNDMDCNFAISHCISESAERYWGRKMSVLPLGVSTQGVSGETKSEIRNVIWVGNIKANKRPQCLLKVARRFPQLRFTMIGDGDMQSAIEAEKPENVTLTGRIPNDQVYDHMQKHDLLLMTSEFEGLPKVIQEAAQCGLPSIYMAENYAVDFLENGVNGYGVHSLEEMCERLSGLLADPEAYRAMSQNARRIIGDYTWPKLIGKYEAFFLRELEKKRSANP